MRRRITLLVVTAAALGTAVPVSRAAQVGQVGQVGQGERVVQVAQATQVEPVAPARPATSATSATSTAARGAAEGAASGIPFRRESVPGFDAGRWAAGVGLALAVAGGMLWWLRRRLPGAAAGPHARRLKVVESLRVSPRTTLLLVELDGRTLLLGEQPGALVLLPAAEAPRDA